MRLLAVVSPAARRRAGVAISLAVLLALMTGPGGNEQDPYGGIRRSLVSPRLLVWLLVGAALVAAPELRRLRVAAYARSAIASARQLRVPGPLAPRPLSLI